MIPEGIDEEPELPSSQVTAASAEVLHLPDDVALADLATLVGRARHVDPNGVARLVAHGDVLAVYVSPLHERGGPTVVGLRTLALAAPSTVDVTVPLGALMDRFAHLGLHAPATHGLPLHGIVPSGAGLSGERRRDTGALSLPPPVAGERWAGMTPPRHGWTSIGPVPADVLEAAAHLGIQQVAAGTPERAGSAAVSALRARVWGAQLDSLASDGAWPPVPMGAAFAVQALGFLDGGDATLHTAGSWLRLSTSHGHVLVRPATAL